MSLEPSRQLATTSLNIKRVFKSKFYEVPPNQRPYSWNNDLLIKMWSDLISTIEENNRDSSTEIEGHFLGAVVVIGGDSSHEDTRLKIIDGQQRLTTISILAECLRSYIEITDDKNTKKCLEKNLDDCVYSYRSKGINIPRIVLNRSNDFYYESMITHETRSEKEQYWRDNLKKKSIVNNKIKNAFEYFYSKIDEHISTGDIDEKLSDLAETLSEKFYLLHVRTEKDWMAYRLFETLNDRGLELSKTDLIKNVLLDNAQDEGDSIVEETNKLWNEILDNYEDQKKGSLDFTQIIQYSFSSRHRNINKEKIFEEVYNDLKKGKLRPLELTQEFHADTENWKNFLSKDIPCWNSTLSNQHKAITENLWKEHCTPFLMAASELFSESTEDMKKCLTLCEHYLFRKGCIDKDSTASLQKVFSQAAITLRDTESLKEVSDLFQRKSSTPDFVDAFKEVSQGNMKIGFYTIWKIEEYLSDVEIYELSEQNTSQHLEFIMPKISVKELNKLENKYEHKKNTHRIGNLLILPSSTYQHIKNKSFCEKITNESNEDYLHTDSFLTRILIDKETSWYKNDAWSYESIVDRQTSLAEEYAAEVWPLSIDKI